MNLIVEMLGRALKLEISKAAEKQLAIIEKPLCLEMELYFSCLIRKSEAFLNKHSSCII